MGGENATTREESTAFETGSPLDQGDSRLAEQLADARQRATKDQPLDASLADEDEDEQQTGNMNTRLAQAPRVREIVGLGDAQLDGGTRDTAKEALGDADASTVIERAAGSIAGSLTRGAARQLLGAAAVLPVTDSGSTTKSAKRAARQPDADSLGWSG